MSSPWSELRLVCSLREGGGGRLRTPRLDCGATSGAPGWKGLVRRHGQLAGPSARTEVHCSEVATAVLVWGSPFPKAEAARVMCGQNLNLGSVMAGDWRDGWGGVGGETERSLSPCFCVYS